jgi:hypothetical protein
MAGYVRSSCLLDYQSCPILRLSDITVVRYYGCPILRQPCGSLHTLGCTPDPGGQTNICRISPEWHDATACTGVVLLIIAVVTPSAPSAATAIIKNIAVFILFQLIKRKY